MKRGHRGDFATPMDHPGRLALLLRALPANGLSRSADSRWPLEVGQAGRAGIFGIIWRVLSAYRYLERSREPGRQLARPMEFSRTRTTSRPTRALETSEKCARFKENEGHANVDPRRRLHSPRQRRSEPEVVIRCFHKSGSRKVRTRGVRRLG